jgi:hypothetical protein
MPEFASVISRAWDRDASTSVTLKTWDKDALVLVEAKLQASIRTCSVHSQSRWILLKFFDWVEPLNSPAQWPLEMLLQLSPTWQGSWNALEYSGTLPCLCILNKIIELFYVVISF